MRGRGRSDFRRRDRDTTRVNQWIRAREVRLIGKEGEHIGVVPVQKALAMSEEAGLDLVEVGAKSVPPVVRIMDYGQFKYEQAKKQKEARKRQKQISVKEVKFRPRIDPHDYETKIRNARRFLDHGDKVKFVVQFRGREMAHRDLGRAVLDRAVEDLADVGQVEMNPRQEGRVMNMVMAPVPEATRRKKQREEEARQAEEEDTGEGESSQETPQQEAAS